MSYSKKITPNAKNSSALTFGLRIKRMAIFTLDGGMLNIPQTKSNNSLPPHHKTNRGGGVPLL